MAPGGSSLLWPADLGVPKGLLGEPNVGYKLGYKSAMSPSWLVDSVGYKSQWPIKHLFNHLGDLADLPTYNPGGQRGRHRGRQRVNQSDDAQASVHRHVDKWREGGGWPGTSATSNPWTNHTIAHDSSLDASICLCVCPFFCQPLVSEPWSLVARG